MGLCLVNGNWFHDQVKLAKVSRAGNRPPLGRDLIEAAHGATTVVRSGGSMTRDVSRDRKAACAGRSAPSPRRAAANRTAGRGEYELLLTLRDEAETMAARVRHSPPRRG
jgi:hypothetical protein